MKEGSDDARAFSLWSLSLAIDADSQPTILERGGEACLVQHLRATSADQQEQAAAALARLAQGNATAQTSIAVAGGISPLIHLVYQSERLPTREAAAATLSSLACIASNRETIMEARGIAPLVALLCDADVPGKRAAAAALAHLAEGGKGASEAIATAGAIAPLVALLTGESGEEAQEEAAGALFALADDAGNRLAITDAAGIGPLVLLLGSSNARAREHAEGALVRLSIENANRECIITKLVSMLFDRGSGGEEQAAAALANLASDSSDNRDSIMDAGGIAPLLALLESGSAKAKEKAIHAISQLAYNERIQRAIADAGGVPMLASALVSTSTNVKDMASSSQLLSLSAYAIAQLADGNHSNQLALAEAGAIPPLVSMLGSPSSEMQANAARALAGLSRDNTDNQAAVARTGAVAPLCSLVREGASNVKEHSAAALWALSERNAPNKATVAKLGGIEPLVMLLMGGETEGSLSNAVGALTSLAAKHADNCETIAKMLVARLTSRMAMVGSGSTRLLTGISILCNSSPANQFAMAKAGGIAPLISWLSGSLDSRQACNEDAQREAARAVLAVAANNASLQTTIVKSDGIQPLISLVSKGNLQAQEYAARTLWHLASSHESVSAIAEHGGMRPLVAMLAVEDSHAQELAAVVVSRLGKSHAVELAQVGAITPLVRLVRLGKPAAQQHAACALAEIAVFPEHRDAIAFEAGGIPPLVQLLKSTVVGTPEMAARALAHLARDELVCGDDGGAPSEAGAATGTSEENNTADPTTPHEKPGAARRNLIHTSGGLKSLISMLWAVPNKVMARRMWDLVATVLGETPSAHSACGAASDTEPPKDRESPSKVKRRKSFDNGTADASDRNDDEDEATALPEGAQELMGQQSAEQAAATLSDLAYGDLDLQDQIIEAGGVPPLLRLIRTGSERAQEHAARAVWHLCASVDNQGVLVECGAVSDLVALSKGGTPAAQELAAAVISDLAKGAILEREKQAANSELFHQPLDSARGVADADTAEASKCTLPAATIHGSAPQLPITVAKGSAPLPPLPMAKVNPAGGAEAGGAAPPSSLDTASSLNDTEPKAPSDDSKTKDRLNAIAAAGGIIPLVSLLSTGSSTGKERAASALWHLSVDPVNQVVVAKAGGIAPLVQLLDDGTVQGTVFAADALAHLAKNSPDNQAAIAKKLVGLLDVRNSDAQRRAAHALWQLAGNNHGAPVRVVNAGAISPLVALLGNGTLEAKEEAAGALSCLAHNDPSSQLAIATGLVALLGKGSAEAQVHVTRMLIKLAQHEDNRDAIVEAEAIERLIAQMEAEIESTPTGAAALAATVLLHLSGDSRSNVEKIMANGGIKPLIALLWSASNDAHVCAAAVLQSMARRSPAEAQSRIVADGAIEPLVRLLSQNYTVSARAEAAGALWSLVDGSREITTEVATTGAIPELVTLLQEQAGANAQRQAARALASLAIGGISMQDSIMQAGAVTPLITLLRPEHGDEAHAAAASALGALVSTHPANQTVAAGAIRPLVSLLTAAGNLAGNLAEDAPILSKHAMEAMEAVASALWAFSAHHADNQTAVEQAGGIPLLANLAGVGSERAQSQAAGALASLALDHAANQDAIATMIVRLLNKGDTSTCTKAARAVSRLARAHPSNQVSIAAMGGIAPLVQMLAVHLPQIALAATETSPFASPLPTPTSLSSSQSRPQSANSEVQKLVKEIACALWSMADHNTANQDAIAEAGGIGLLVKLLECGVREVHRNAAGVLWSIADSAANQRRIANESAIAPLVALIAERNSPAQSTAAGALHSLASLRENCIAIADAGGVPALVALFECRDDDAKQEAADGLSALVRGYAANQHLVADQLVTVLSDERTSEVAREHITKLMHTLSLDAEMRASLSKAGAIPQLAAQLSIGTTASMSAAASALSQIALVSSQYRIQVTAQLIKLFSSDVEGVRQRAGAALQGMSESGRSGSDTQQMTVAMAGGMDRFVTLLKDGSVEAQEYALWLLWQSSDMASKVSIARAGCAKPIIRCVCSGKLSDQALEHAAAVLALLASKLPGVEATVHAANTEDILSAGGVAPLVRLLRSGSDGAKRYGAAALTQMACAAEGCSEKMQAALAKAGAITAFIEWLLDPSLGRPELAAQALAQISSGRSVDAQVTIAEEGAIEPLVDMLNPDCNSMESQKWAASALAALSEGHSVNQIAVAEQGGIPPLVELLRREKSSKSHESATRALWHLAEYADNRIVIVNEGAVPPLVSLLSRVESEQGQEWAAAALRALSDDCLENQVALARAGAIAPLIALLGSGAEEMAGHAQGALLHIAAANGDTRNGVVRALVALLEGRNPAAQMKAAESLAILASRSMANRASISAAGAIQPLVEMLGDGRHVSTTQVHAAAALCDLARASETKPTMVRAGAVVPLVRMLNSSHIEGQVRASGALCYLSSTSSAQQQIAEANGLTLLVALLSSERMVAANNAAGAIWHLASTTTNRTAIVKAGGIPRLVTLLELTESLEARESAAAILAELARSNSPGCRDNPRAIVAAGGIPPLVQLLSASECPSAQKHAACALWGLTSDGQHESAVVRAGAIPPLIALVWVSSEAQGYACAALCNTARGDKDARAAIIEAGGIEPLADLARGSKETWLRSQATAILEVLPGVGASQVSQVSQITPAKAPTKPPQSRPPLAQAETSTDNKRNVATTGEPNDGMSHVPSTNKGRGDKHDKVEKPTACSDKVPEKAKRGLKRPPVGPMAIASGSAPALVAEPLVTPALIDEGEPTQGNFLMAAKVKRQSSSVAAAMAALMQGPSGAARVPEEAKAATPLSVNAGIFASPGSAAASSKSASRSSTPRSTGSGRVSSPRRSVATNSRTSSRAVSPRATGAASGASSQNCTPRARSASPRFSHPLGGAKNVAAAVVKLKAAEKGHKVVSRQFSPRAQRV